MFVRPNAKHAWHERGLPKSKPKVLAQNFLVENIRYVIKKSKIQLRR